MRRHISFLLAVCCIGLLGADWFQFRGNDGASSASGEKPPVELSEKTLAWRADLPGRGPSSPIVVGDKVIVTCSDGVTQDRILVCAFSAKTGQQLWRREFWATGRTSTHPTSAVAAPTPASDGKFIYAFYSSNDLVCLDLDGNLQWYRGLAHDYPKAGNDIGMSASPVVAGNAVVVQVENQGNSFAAGLNKVTGETLWKIPRSAMANWTSPMTLKMGGKLAVVLQSPGGVTAHDAMTGVELWRFDESCDNIASPVTGKGRVYLPSNGTTVLEIADGSNSPEILWDNNQVSGGPASAMLSDDKFLVMNRSGVLVCADPNTGKIKWRERVGGTHWGTPILANGHVYAVNHDGTAAVVAAGDDEGKVVSKFALEETIQSSPAIAGDALFVRSDKHLWKFAQATD